MSNKNNQYQIDRKDAKNCFVESLSDFFAYGKVHFNFITYDTSKPEGERITNYVNIYIEVDKFLEFCRKLSGGELRYIIQQKQSTGDSRPIGEWLGGISAKKLAESGNARKDGRSLSRVAKLLCGSRSDFLFVADSGAGEQNRQGLIVPRFGTHPENHVAVSLSWDSLAELFLLTKEHYQAWLSSWYLSRMLAGQKLKNAGMGGHETAVYPKAVQQAAGSQIPLQQGDACYRQHAGQAEEQKLYQQIPNQQNGYRQNVQHPYQAEQPEAYQNYQQVQEYGQGNTPYRQRSA